MKKEINKLIHQQIVKIQQWKTLEKLHFSSRYIYPGEKIEEWIKKEFPEKPSREARILKKFLPKKCGTILLDYGCGEGKMFKYIKQHHKKYPSLIVGIEPDRSCLVKAKKMLLNDGGRGVFLNTTFDNPIFLQQKLANSLFCIICIQVLGHVSDTKLHNILKTFHFLLEPRGTLVLAIPVVNDKFSFPGWKRGNDFLRVTNLLLPNHQKYRIALSPDDFSRFADYPPPNLLPTRSFYIEEKIEIGHICNEHKITRGRLNIFKKYGFSLKNAIIYNKFEKGSGDLIMQLFS